MIDIDAVRADTPACEGVLHFNNAGASLMPQPVFAAMVGHLELERDRGGYEAADLAHAELAGFYTEFAALLGAAPEEIAFVENATRAWDMAFYGLPLKAGDRILTHASEYVSNYLGFLQMAKKRGVAIDLVPSDEHGQIDIAALETMIGPHTRLIAITHIPTQGGLVNPAAEVGAIAAKHGLFYLLDACQSCGQLDLDVKQIGCHILSGTGRKFLRGPRGTGFLYVSAEIMDQVEPPFIDLRAANWISGDAYELAPGAVRYENWESYVAGRVGLARAVQYARSIGLPAIEARTMQLGADLREALSHVPGLQLHDQGVHKCGIVTFSMADRSPQQILAQLRERSINVSVSSQSSARLDFGARNLQDVVRASVHYFNTHNEIDRFTETIKSL